MLRPLKSSLLTLILFLPLVLGCAHSPDPASRRASSASPQLTLDADNAGAVSQPSPVMSNPPESLMTPKKLTTGEERSINNEFDLDYLEEAEEEGAAGISDPLEPFNRAMYHVNDKLYFWVLKPVARGYGKVVPEPGRVKVSNFFSNLTSPISFVNCLLQANPRGAATELGRFVINSLWGIGGLWDPASSQEINLPKQDEDFGQTLGVFGLGHGFFINWPILGPSSPRDTVGMMGDSFFYILNYVHPSDVALGLRTYDKVNDASLRIGDYESLKELAIDPYVALRNAYVQHRLNKVKARGVKRVPSQSGGESSQKGNANSPPSVPSEPAH